MATSFTIQNLEPEVLYKTENRTTDVSRVDNWIRDALLELTADTDYRDEFDNLEILGPLFNLTGGSSVASGAVQEYAFSNLIPSNTYNVNTLDIILWTNPPQNSTNIRLENTSYQEADMITRFTGQPVKWYRFADVCGFVPVPNLNYQVQARIYQLHPLATPLNQTVLLIPNDWNEILVLMAVEKGFLELMQYEKAAAVHKLLHGDPLYPKKPGMMQGRKKRRAKENWRQQKPLRPIVRGYTYGFTR